MAAMKRASKESDFDAAMRAIEASGHSVFAPSAAHRWLRCPGSLRAALVAKAALTDEDGTPLGGSNIYSVTGSAAHHVAETWLTANRRPNHLLGTIYEREQIQVEITQEMLDYVEMYVVACRAFGYDKPPYRGVERRVSFGDLFPIPNQSGTCDFWFYDLVNRHLYVLDLKYGTGVRVYAAKNEQEMLYALGVIRHFTEHAIPLPEKITLRIVQPRLEHDDSWTLDLIELFAFAHKVRTVARQAWEPDAERTPDEKACRFCPLKATCPALADEIEELADDLFDEADEPVRARRVSKMDTARMAKLLRWRPTMESWLKSIKEELLSRADGGETVEGFKIAVGRRSRGWISEKKARDALELLGLDRSEMFKETFKSPKQIEDALKLRRWPKAAIKSLVHVTDGPRTLVPVLDPREGLASVADIFDDEEGDDGSL